MRGLWKLTRMEALLYVREPMASFFTLVFPILLLVLFGSIYGNKPNPFFGGHGTVDVSTPAYIGIIIGSTALMSIPIGLGTYRERGILRRLKATPLRPGAIIVAEIIVHYAMTLLGAVLLIVSAKLGYGLQFAGNPLFVFLAFTLSALSFFAVGFLLASLAPSARVAYVVGMVFLLPEYFPVGGDHPQGNLPADAEGDQQVRPHDAYRVSPPGALVRRPVGEARRRNRRPRRAPRDQAPSSRP